MSRFVREAFKERKLLAVIVASIIGATLATLASPYILRIAIDEYIVPGKYAGLPMIAGLYLTALVLQWLFTTIQTYYVEKFGQSVLEELRARIHRKIIMANIDFFKDKKTGDLVSRIINDTGMVNDVLVSGLLGGIGSTLSLVGIIGAMFYLDIKLTLVVLLSVPVMVFVAKYFGGKIRTAYRQTRKEIARISNVVEEGVSGIETVKAFGRERKVEEEFERASKGAVKAYIKVAFYMGLFWPLMNISSLLSIVLVLAYGGYLAYTGAISVGIVVAFIQYTQRFRGPINEVVSMYDSLQSALAALERIYEIIDDPNIETFEGIKIEKLDGHVKFENVWFWYKEGKPVLKNINIDIPPGTTIALVGKTGAGKTTMANLIMRFYDPKRGHILYDDLVGMGINKQSLRSRISYVPQETYLFPGSIMENIKIAKPGSTDGEVINVCKQLGIHEFIERLPKGYETPAGEAGKLLSVGEKQLISIARAMLKNPDIVILDEALSSVDPKTESLVQHAILKLMEGRTSIIIAHRLTITRFADEILVLDNGEIIEHGEFKELLSREGKFYELYNLQISPKITV
ncbi:MAG: ABC transporter ATP-binding protein/permease [Desulfurococcales archaeon]|nr:ABC transporter ATP-binding protein/permease [Desulfurococcales archaeon]